MQCKIGKPRWTKPRRHALAGRKRTWSGSKLPMANSRSGSLEGLGASGNLLSMEVLVAMRDGRVLCKMGFKKTVGELKVIKSN